MTRSGTIWLICIFCALASVMGFSRAAAEDSLNTTNKASSEIRRESNGFWLYIDGVKTPVFGGAVYQNTEGDMHIVTYSNSMHSLYSPLDAEADGGSGHGERLAQMGFQAIRVYELPVNNREDADHVKEIFRRLYENYHIKVLVGDWAGLHEGIDFQNSNDVARVRSHLTRLVATYCDEPWVLGWQIGNENNFHTRDGKLGHEINLDAAGYYALMDSLAGNVKAELGKCQAKQFVALGQGDLSSDEADLIARMKNIDAVGINCYRGDQRSFDELINLAASQIPRPIYFAEVGKPAATPEEQKEQSDYLWRICSTIFSEGAGRTHSGDVIGVFVHETTDEAWKRNDRGQESDAHFGFLGKPAESALRSLLTQNRDFSAWVLPTNDAPDSLTRAAWGCLAGPYADRYGRDYGDAMAYAYRTINLYQDEARTQQQQLVNFKSPPELAANDKFWALNTVGTAYFILGDRWMLQSYDYKGSEKPHGLNKWLQLADVDEHKFIATTNPMMGVVPTNSANCVYYARQVFAILHTQYPSAHLREANGTYWQLDHAVATRFPELTPPYLPLTWQNDAIFTASGLVLVLGIASLCGWRARRDLVKTERVLSAPARMAFVGALILNLASLYWFLSWWFDPIRMRYYTVMPALFWMLTGIGTLGILFYFFFWFVLWNMRRPVPMAALEGLRVAVVTTRVPSEPVEGMGKTFEGLSSITYPHDSYLLDEEDSDLAKAACERSGVIHFSRKGKPLYNQPSGNFQAKTKGGNLNSWLFEFGNQYEFVTFLDPDHIPHPDFLDRVLGYFTNPKVAFVQAPQVLYNRRDNWIARGAAEQSYFFYGPVLMGLFGIGACVVNGSHSTFRVSELFALRGGSYAVHDADDMLTSIRMHAGRKAGVYVPEVLAEGLAPDTWAEFAKQQRRWAYSMFQLFFHYYIPEFRGMPWRCRLVYLVLTGFYFRGVAFAGLLLLPFISAFTGNPPVNAHVISFCLRFVPFFLLHTGILLFIGQRFLIPQGSERGFWFRAGLLWVAMWWDNLCAMFKGLRTRRVADRVVAAKWKASSDSPWNAVRAHVVLTIAAITAFTVTCLRSGTRETIWGTLLFLGLIVLSQGVIIWKVVRSQRNAVPAEKTAAEPRPVEVSAMYSPTQKL
jgi:hypothetical protein